MNNLEQLSYDDPTYNEELIEDIYKTISDAMKHTVLKNEKDLIFNPKITDTDEYLLQNLNSITWSIEVLRNDHYLTWWHEKARGEKHSTFVKNLIYNIGLFVFNAQIRKKDCNEKVRNILDKLEQMVLIRYNQVLSPQACYNLTYGCEFLSQGHYGFVLSSIVFIRIAIEKKIKWMLGIKDQNNFIKLSKMIDFLEQNHQKYFDLPKDIDFKKLGVINTWCNHTMIHNGIVPYLWTLWEAIEIISPLFRTEKNGSINLEGFTYRKDPNEDSKIAKELENFKSKK